MIWGPTEPGFCSSTQTRPEAEMYKLWENIFILLQKELVQLEFWNHEFVFVSLSKAEQKFSNWS